MQKITNKTLRGKLNGVRYLMTLRSNTQEVELNSVKISSIDPEAAAKLPTGNLFFLHGLLGKGQNWKSFALNDVLSNNRNLHLIDLRNHGDSDHHSSMTYSEMATDVIRYADHRQIDKIALIGHNCGAKTAMTLSCMFPDRVSALVSLDTAPISFREDQQVIKQTLDHLN